MFRRAACARLAAALALAAPAAAEPATAPPPPSGDWRLVVTDEEPDVGRILGFADAGTLVRSGTAVRFWLEYRLEKAAEGADGYRGYVSADCSSHAYGSVGLARLDGARVIEEGGSESGLTARPGTNLRVALDHVCAGTFLSGRVDPVAFARQRFGRGGGG
jgi:hypothetical protein